MQPRKPQAGSLLPLQKAKGSLEHHTLPIQPLKITHPRHNGGGERRGMCPGPPPPHPAPIWVQQVAHLSQTHLGTPGLAVQENRL